MDDLKYLEEVLPAYRAGRSIDLVIDGMAYGSNKNVLIPLQEIIWKQEERRLDIDKDVILSRCWRIRKELVPWPVAWEALKAGKRIMLNGREYRITDCCGENLLVENCGCDFNYDRDRKIPLSWLDREDFEVLD